MPLIIFDIFPTDDLYIDTFGFDSDPLSESFAEMGYEMTDAIFNMGSLFLMIFAFPIIALSIMTLHYNCPSKCYCKREWK